MNHLSRVRAVNPDSPANIDRNFLQSYKSEYIRANAIVSIELQIGNRNFAIVIFKEILWDFVSGKTLRLPFVKEISDCSL